MTYNERECNPTKWEKLEKKYIYDEFILFNSFSGQKDK